MEWFTQSENDSSQVQAFEDNAMVGASAYRLVFFTGPSVSSEKIRLDPLDSRERSLQ